MSEFINALANEFVSNANSAIAAKQKAYMKERFEHFGLTSPIRNKLQQPFLISKFLPTKEALDSIIKELWTKPEREFQYFGQELIFKYKAKFELGDIELFEYMIINKSWWDSVDFIASNILGTYFILYPQQRKSYIKKWLGSDNMWLQRSALLSN